MSCQLLIENNIGKKGEISSLTPIDSVWSQNETLSEWVLSNLGRPLSEYHRNYIKIIITDKSLSEFSYKTEPLIIDGAPVSNRYFFIEPSSQTQLWSELFTTGQTSKKWADVELWLRDRNGN